MSDIIKEILDEERELARAEGRAEERLLIGKLIEKLQADNNQEAISRIFKDDDFRQQMYAKYHIGNPAAENHSQRHQSIDEHFADFDDKYVASEVDWEPPVGKEI